MKPSGRLLSLDVMRGITIAGMIMVNNPGSWNSVYAPLQHVSWDGLTPTDLVFPFFMFIMGISMYLSLSKYNFKLTAVSFGKILKRTILIFLVGLGLNLFSQVVFNGFDTWANLRILGVMQRLAIAYGVGSLIGLSINKKYLLHVSGFLLVGYAILLSMTDSLVLSTHNLVAVLDQNILGASHLYQVVKLPDGSSVPFDPEGLLSAVGSIAQVLLGFYVGKMIVEKKREEERLVLSLFIFGTIILFAGFLFSYGCPINKKLWSSTFVLVSSGFGSLLLALLIWLIDIRKRKNWSFFFEVFGINPLYLYVQAAVLSVVFSKIGLQSYGFDLLASIMNSYLASLVWAILFVVVNWIPGYILYKKKIYIKL